MSDLSSTEPRVRPAPIDSALRVGGVTPFTTIDYPGELAAVVFCQGCPWRCRYCQNGHLLACGAASELDWVGLDVKALPEDYAALTGVRGSGERALESLGNLVASGVAHEVWITVHDALLPADKLRRLIALLTAPSSSRHSAPTPKRSGSSCRTTGRRCNIIALTVFAVDERFP